jgi:REP element-mobilizing transposase RayT
MPTWRPNFNPEHLYFVTTKAVDYAHVFRREVLRRLLVDTLDCLRAQKRMKLYSFVVMPNHVHFNPCQPHWNLSDAPGAISGRVRASISPMRHASSQWMTREN